MGWEEGQAAAQEQRRVARIRLQLASIAVSSGQAAGTCGDTAAIATAGGSARRGLSSPLPEAPSKALTLASKLTQYTLLYSTRETGDSELNPLYLH